MRNKKAYWSLVLVLIILAWSGWIAIFRVLYFKANFIWSVPVIIFFFTLALLLIYILSEHRKRSIYLATAAVTLPSLLMMGQYWYLMAPAWLAGNLLIGIGIERIKTEQENRRRIIPHSLVRFGLSVITTAVSLLIAANYYLSVRDISQTPGVPQVRLTVPRQVVYSALDVAGSLMPEQNLRSISQGTTVDEFLGSRLKSSLSIDAADIEQYMADQGQPLTPEEKENIRRQAESFTVVNDQAAIKQARAQLSEQIGAPLSGSETMKDVMVAYVNRRIAQFFNGDSGNQEILPLGMALALFLTLKAMAWMLSYPLAWTTTGIFHIMVKMKWIMVDKVQREVEEVMV